MPGPSRAGVLIYALDLERLSSFYEHLLGMRVLAADAEHRVLESDDIQLIVHAIPPEYAVGVTVAAPPEPRSEQAIKPFFTVPSLARAEADAAAFGGFVFGPQWDGPGFRVRNACDPEGNVIQFREFGATERGRHHE